MKRSEMASSSSMASLFSQKVNIILVANLSAHLFDVLAFRAITTSNSLAGISCLILQNTHYIIYSFHLSEVGGA